MVHWLAGWLAIPVGYGGASGAPGLILTQDWILAARLLNQANVPIQENYTSMETEALKGTGHPTRLVLGNRSTGLAPKLNRATGRHFIWESGQG